MASLCFSPKTLSPIPPNPNPSPNSTTRNSRRPLPPPASAESERGVSFGTGDSFFRRESSVSRDLAILATSLHRRDLLLSGEASGLRALDAMCGCGVRALRYLAHGAADFVWANDASEECRPLILANLATAPASTGCGGERRWVVSHAEVSRLLAERYLRREYFDVIDVDSFGSDSAYVRMALAALRIGGLLYVTSTDGRSSGGHRPSCSLASYGAYVRPMPYSNEVGLRMLIGGAVREAAILGFHISPLFSYYSYHGPVFRVMLRLCDGKDHDFSYYGFISYCNKCGHSKTFPWDELGQISCICRDDTVSSSTVVTGPLWTGPLHDAAFVAEMLRLAAEWGWAYSSENGIDLEKLLSAMINESDPQLPPGYIKLDEIARRAKINSPPINTLINMLRKEGYAASRSHINPNAIKTNCPMASCIQIALDI